jgi:membrane protein implicated in regulation of membrane protease activity
MQTPEEWRWVWIVGSAVFAVGEILTTGSFFLLPFAVGALVAAILAFAGIGVAVEWVAFVAVSIAVLVALRPLARRLDRSALDQGVGARRLVGMRATVIEAIPGDAELGMVRVEREEWRAQSTDGSAIAEGTVVRVADIQGTRLVVAADTPAPPPLEPPGTAGSPEAT